MPENKTKPTTASVEDYLAERGTTEQIADAISLIALLEHVTGCPPVMWGPSIVGFGRYRYTYQSGHGGEMCRTGFAIRGRDLVLYLLGGGPEQEALRARLGKHRMSKSCLYFKRLADLDLGVLEQLVVSSLEDLARRYDHPATS